MMKLEIPKSSLLAPLLSLPPCTPTPPPEKMLSTGGGGGVDIKWNGPQHSNDANLWKFRNSVSPPPGSLQELRINF